MSVARCHEMGRNPLQLIADWLGGAGETRFPHSKDQRIFLTQSGRAAVALAARCWGLRSADEILVPAYNCGSEISPLIATGSTVKMYRVDRGANIDVPDIVSRITARTRAILVTNYFGRPAQLGNLGMICRERNIKLLEDCAHSLFSSRAEAGADAFIFSLRKSLPASDGGILIINAADATAARTSPASVVTTTRGALSLIKKDLQQRGAINRRDRSSSAHASSSLPDIPESYYWSAASPINSASRFARGLLNRTNSEMVVARRRQNYHRLREHLTGLTGFRLLWEEQALPPGICPLGLPLIVEDRPRWCHFLNEAEVQVSRWWEGYHRGLDWTGFGEARELKDHLVLLPVHQNLTPHHMDYVADVVATLSRHK